MNTKQYKEPKIEVETFEEIDVITTSGGTGGTDLPDDEF